MGADRARWRRPSASPRGRLLRLLLALAAAVALQLGAAAPVTAQGSGQLEGEPEPMGLEVVAVQGVLPAPSEAEPDPVVGATVDLSSGAQAREDLRAVTTVYSRVTSAEALDAALLGDTDAVYASVSTPLPDMPPGATERVTVEAAAEDLDLSGGDLEGVYPMEVRIFEGPDAVGAASTALVVQPEASRRPLPATWVVDVTADTLPVLSDDVIPTSLQDLLAPGGPLVTQTRELLRAAADGSAAGLVLAPSGRLAADLAALADGADLQGGPDVDDANRVARRAAATLDRLRHVARRGDVEVLALPYGPADLVALARGGQDRQALELVDLGVRTVTEVLGVAPTSGVIVPPDGVDADTVAALGPTQADAFLLDARYLAFADHDTLEPVRRLRTADGGEVRILMPDGGLSALLRDPRGVGVPLVVQRLRAETALRWMADGAGDAEAVLLHTAIPGDLPDGMLDALDDALTGTPWLRPVDLSTLSRSVAPSDRVVRLAYPPSSRAAELGDDYIALLGEASEALRPLRALLPQGDEAADRFARSLLGAASTAYRSLDGEAAGLARIAEVLDTIAGISAGVSVIEGPPITLTSTTGEIPVALRNDTDLPLDVRVSLASTRFSFAEPVQELTLPPRSVQTLTFGARALNPGGLAGVGVVVEDPTGQLRLVSTTIAVRSTAFPVVALVATVGGALLLGVWGLQQGRRRRGAHEARRRSDERAA